MATSADQAAGDYVPYAPSIEELPTASAAALMAFVGQFPAAERERGAMLAAEAVRRYTGPVEGDADRRELVVTHNFLVGWLVRAALDAPNWRWLSLNHANAGLTVIRYAPTGRRLCWCTTIWRTCPRTCGGPGSVRSFDRDEDRVTPRVTGGAWCGVRLGVRASWRGPRRRAGAPVPR